MSFLDILQVIGSVAGFFILLIMPLLSTIYKYITNRLDESKKERDKIEKRVTNLEEKVQTGALQDLEVWGKVNATLSRIDTTLVGIQDFIRDSKKVDERQDYEIKELQKKVK